MNYNFSEKTFPSSDGIHTIYAEIYTPKTASARGVIQLAHGMIDYVGRYKDMADYLTGEGFILAGNHHLGHGKSVKSEEEFGYFAKSGGVDFVIEDMHRMNKQLREMFPTLPIILFGHSMGSFLTRLYVEKHPHSIKGAVIHGTAGPNPALPMGKLLAKIIIALRGGYHKSNMLKGLAIGAYQKKYKKEGKNAWLSTDADMIADHDDDAFSNFDFTASGYYDLFTMLHACNKKAWFANYPKSLSTLIMAGEDDPVGANGKGPRYVYKTLLVSGAQDVTLKMYEGDRHELFKEADREKVFADLVGWLNEVVEKTRVNF